MPKHTHQLAFVALILWLFSNWIGLHGHFCFDGQEPPVSVHVHLDAHNPHEHHPDEQHVDADVELLQLVIAKLGKLDTGLLLFTVLLLLLVIVPRRGFSLLRARFFIHPPFFLHPPLRAPPVPA